MNKVAFFMIAALLLGLCTVAAAQEFPDVPPDHWAYDAVQELVDQGIIQGYPDGTFGGKRAMTRYEFAEALAKAIPVIIDMAGGGGDGTEGRQGPPGKDGVAGPPGPKGEPGVGAEQLATIQRMMDEFQDELASLGVQVESVRRDLNALTERVNILEDEVNRVKINGGGNLIVRGEVENNSPAFDRDTRSLSVGTSGTSEADNPLANSSFFTDFQLGIVGRVSEDASLNAEINAGNYLQDFALGSVDDFSLWKLNLSTAMKLGPLGQGEVTVGRFPFQLTPLTLKFVDPDSYTYVDKLDDGNFVMDGGSIMFNWSKLSLTAFAAKTGDSIIADLITPDLLLGGASGVEVSQIGGARATIGITSDGNIGLTWYQAGVGLGATNATTNIMGADINAMFGSLGIAAEWAETDPDQALNDAFVANLDDGNTAWNANLAFQAGNLGLKAGYSTVEENYYAPGNWSRLGAVANLVNVKGPMANLTYALTDNISLSAEGQWLDPDNDIAGATVTGKTAITQGPTVGVLAADLDKITSWKAGIKYGLTSSNSVDLGWEQVNWEAVAAGSDTEERYISIGLGHTFNPNASMKLLYQIVSYEQGVLTPYSGASEDSRGGIATAQFAVKF